MKETVKVSVDCNPALLAEAELLFAELGYTLEEAFSAFLAETAERGEPPFDMEARKLSRAKDRGICNPS